MSSPLLLPERLWYALKALLSTTVTHSRDANIGPGHICLI